MTNRVPSAAQAAALGAVAEYEATGVELYWRPDGGWRSMAALVREEIDPNHGWVACMGQRDVREVSVRACVRRGWIEAFHETVLAQGIATAGAEIIGGDREPKPVVVRQLALTEDGTIALGLWRERKLKAPPAPLPKLAGRARDVVELATRAMALGFRLAPETDSARSEARQLRRDGWVQRGYLGAGTRTLVPTGLGQVEVAPEVADHV